MSNHSNPGSPFTAADVAKRPVGQVDRLTTCVPIVVSGSKASGDALQSLLDALSALNLIEDQTTA